MDTRRFSSLAVFPALLVTGMAQTPAQAQAPQQKIRAPLAVYWMSAETAGGVSMPGLPAGLGAFLPGAAAGGKRIKLDLGSTQAPNAEPGAAHAVPAAFAMGPSLPLVTPRVERVPSGPVPESEEAPEPQRPKGRMLVYWGCSETIRPGQPLVFDFAKMNPVEAGRVFRSRSVSRPAGPGPSRNRTYGTWPNPQDSRPVPAQSSLRGDHAVTGNYSPEMRFAVDERHDFMDPVAFDPVRKTPAGAFALKWKSIPTAIGYFATAFGQGENQGDVVMWSASEVQEVGAALMDYLPPAEVARLIKEKVALAPQTTECAVPAGAFRGAGAMLQFIAYGDEVNIVQPPRPADPKLAWEQEWAMKLRLKATAMVLLAEGVGGVPSGAASREPQASQESPPDASRPRPAAAPSAGEALKEGINVLRGIFGR